MCGPTVNYTQQNYGTATEKLAFECDKNFSAATTNLHQQNPSMTINIRNHSLSCHLRITVCLVYLIGEKKTGHKINRFKLLVGGNFSHFHKKLVTFPQLNFR